jgi:hypothetical protein
MPRHFPFLAVIAVERKKPRHRMIYDEEEHKA